jgi:hypothetical protein
MANAGLLENGQKQYACTLSIQNAEVTVCKNTEQVDPKLFNDQVEVGEGRITAAVLQASKRKTCLLR